MAGPAWAAFERQVIDLARWCGWRVAHFRPALTPTGWRTPVGGDGKGFPDLVLCHPRRRRVMFVELKAGRGYLEPAQRAWADALVAGGAEYHVWRPAMWDEIKATLQGQEDGMTTTEERKAAEARQRRLRR